MLHFAIMAMCNPMAIMRTNYTLLDPVLAPTNIILKLPVIEETFTLLTISGGP